MLSTEATYVALKLAEEAREKAPNDPGIGDRSTARVMTPVEAPMLQPSMGLDPDRFSLLKKPLR